MSPISIIGCIDSGDILAHEIARLLKCKAYILPITPLHLQNGTDKVYGAACGVHAAPTLDSELAPQDVTIENIQARLNLLKSDIFKEAHYSQACAHWSNAAQSISKTTALLIDSVIISKPKLNAALSSLASEGITKVIILAAFIYKPVLHGNIFPIRDGIFLKWFDNLEQLKIYAQQINTRDGQQIRSEFQLA